MCTGVIGLSLLVVLFINAALSAGAFRQHALEIDVTLVSESEEALAQAVQVDEAPMTIEKRARALGMVPAGSPVFLDLGKGKVLGEPVPAPSPTTSFSFDDELTAPPERLVMKLVSPTPQPTATATVTVTATPSAPATGGASAGTNPGSGVPAPSTPTATPAAPSASPDVSAAASVATTSSPRD